MAARLKQPHLVVWLCLLLLSSLPALSYTEDDISEEFLPYQPQEEDRIHAVKKRQAVATSIDWDDEHPFLDGPNTEEISIRPPSLIQMNEEMIPNVTIAQFNYRGGGTVEIRHDDPANAAALIGLTAHKDDAGIFWLVSTVRQDYEAGHRDYSVYITVREEGLPPKGRRLIVEIINIDDNPPLVRVAPCTVDELYVGDTECEFHIYDADGDISTSVMEFRFLGSAVVEESFQLTGVRVEGDALKDMYATLSVKTELLFLDHQIHVFDLMALDSLPNNGTAQVIVRVNDVENMPPIWQAVLATETFDEKTPQRFVVRAIDGDTGLNQPICYRVQSADSGLEMSVGEASGSIAVEPIDRDALEREVFAFELVAYKCHNASWSTNSTGVFIVKDINDQLPRSATPHFEISIPEETYVPVELEPTITFHDRDLGINARYQVELESISPPGAADSFLVIPRDGYQRQEFQISIINATNLDFDDEPWQTVMLKVVATEELNTNHVDSCTVTIHLHNWNDELPIFDREVYTAQLEETVEAGAYVTTVRATDRDIGDQVTYSIRGSSHPYLQLDAETGVMTVRSNDSFDYDRQAEVVVQVQAQDSLNATTHTVLTQVVISVVDVNNKPPQIIMPRELITVEEHPPSGHVLTEAIEGSDVDTDADIVFDIDWESSYATKQGRLVEPSLYAGCVDIVTVYTPPESTRSAKGRLVARQVGAQLNETLDFEVIEVLYLSIRLTDRATVVNSNYTQGILSLTIEDINDNPPVWSPDTDTRPYFVREEADADTVIDSVQATDIDGPQFNVISYSISPRNGTPGDLVKVNPRSGQMSVMLDKAISADFPSPTYHLYYTLTASDCTPNTPLCYRVPIQIEIYIVDTNNQVPFEQTTGEEERPVYLEEHSPAGTVVTRLRGGDLDRDDPYNNVSYVIDYRNVQGLEKVFEIDIRSGVITTKEPQDLERDYGVTSHTIPIQLIDNFYFEKDRTQRTNTTSVVVILRDINDNAPQFQTIHEEWRILEDAPVDSQVGVVRAFDRDEKDTPNSRITYVVEGVRRVDASGGEADVEEELFAIRTEETGDADYQFIGVVVTKQLLQSHWGTYNLSIQAHDMAVQEPRRNTTVHQLVVVDPFNFHSPDITYPGNGQTIVLVVEDTERGILRYPNNRSELNPISAVDADGGDAGRVSFRILGDEEAKQVFSLRNLPDNRAEFLLVKNIPDPKKFEVHLLATDHGFLPRASNITFTFDVTSLEAMPSFDDPVYTTNFTEGVTGLEESQELPTASDPLPGRPLYYHITDHKDLFSLDKDTRVISLLQPLNRTQTPEYSINYRVTVEDTEASRYAEMTVIIQVREENPRPVFDSHEYVRGISITDEISKRLLTIKATHSEHLAMEYHIDQESMVADPSVGHISEAFLLDPTTGDLLLAFKPLASMSGRFEFQVVATDTNNQSSSVGVVVFLVSETNRIKFTFHNTLEQVELRSNEVSEILSEVFEYQCSINSIVKASDQEGVPVDNKTDVFTHFMRDNLPVGADHIADKRGDYEFVTNMIRRFAEVDLVLGDFATFQDIADSLEQLLQIILIVVSTVLGTLCVLLVAAFCFKTKSLNRRLKALAETQFGSQDSGLNRAGVAVPGTNKHAIEGSNPVWNEETNAPNFDQLSNYSGDSDLIGIEDNPQFSYSNQGAQLEEGGGPAAGRKPHTGA